MKLLFVILFLPFPKEVPYRTLSWSDFKGKPEKGALATTCSGIVIEGNKTVAIFYPYESGTLTNDVAALRHEQLHFDITQMYARKIKYGSDSKEAIKEWILLEDQYDKETNHGLNMEVQKKWEQKIKP